MAVRYFLNTVEQKTFEILIPIAKRHGYDIFPKVRFADAVDLDALEIKGRDKTYALCAHLDFLLVFRNSACFAIEVDGPEHFKDDQAPMRDLRKNSLCEKLGLDLLRIDTNYFHKLKDQTVLSILAEDIMARRKYANRSKSQNHKQPLNLRALELETQTILNRVKKFENQLYTFKTQEDEFHYTASILEHRQDKYVVGQGCAHISSVLATEHEKLADLLSLLDLNRRLNLPLSRIDPAMPKEIASAIRSCYEFAEEFPTVRMQMLKYTGQVCFPDEVFSTASP